MSTADIIVIAVIVLCVCAAIAYMVRCKKNGKSCGCSGDCSSCSGCNNADKR